MNLVEKQLQFTTSGAAEFVFWMLLVVAIGIIIGMMEDKNGRGR